MIPVVSLADFVIATIASVIAWDLRLAYRRSKAPIVFYFGLFYLLLGAFFFCESLPLAINDGWWIGFANMVGYIFLGIALAYLAYISLTLAGNHELGIGAYYFLIVYSLFFAAIRWLDFMPSVAETSGVFVYWRPVFEPWLRITAGVLCTGVGTLTMGTFFYHAQKHRSNAVVYWRAMWIVIGMFLATAGSVLGLILAPQGSFASVVVATLLAILFLLAILRGVTYERRGDTPATTPTF